MIFIIKFLSYSYSSNDIKKRLIEHNSGKGAGYTKSRMPVELVGISPEMTKRHALRLEYRIKQVPTNRKISELKREENEMTIYKKDLQALNKEIKALSKKMETLIKEFDKSKKVKVAKKVTTKSVKAKTTKRVPTKKVPVKRRTAKLTATEKVLRIIMGRKRGVDVATLRKKTGFDDRKITNILHRAFKAGKIKRIDRGIYVGA